MEIIFGVVGIKFSEAASCVGSFLTPTDLESDSVIFTNPIPFPS